MAEASRHDSWQAGDSYDAYMGRWSRKIAPRFIEWLDAPEDQEWLEIGCGTGALSEAILAQGRPKSLISIDSSEGFIARARQNVVDDRVVFEVGDGQALTVDSASQDVIVSALVLNFVPDREKMLAEMKRVARPGGRIGTYVWDYPGRGVEFMRAFWDAAAALDPDAAGLAENRRFPYCSPDGLTEMAESGGLTEVGCSSIEVPTVFRDFENLWRPFTLGAGPAPGYCAKLDPAAQQRLKARLHASLPEMEDGSIPLKARAWALKAVAA